MRGYIITASFIIPIKSYQPRLFVTAQNRVTPNESMSQISHDVTSKNKAHFYASNEIYKFIKKLQHRSSYLTRKNRLKIRNFIPQNSFEH